MEDFCWLGVNWLPIMILSSDLFELGSSIPQVSTKQRVSLQAKAISLVTASTF